MATSRNSLVSKHVDGHENKPVSVAKSRVKAGPARIRHPPETSAALYCYGAILNISRQGQRLLRPIGAASSAPPAAQVNRCPFLQ